MFSSISLKTYKYIFYKTYELKKSLRGYFLKVFTDFPTQDTWAIFFFSFPSTSSCLFFFHYFTLTVVSSLDMREILHQPILSCLYRLIENCKLPTCLPCVATRVPEKMILVIERKPILCFGFCFKYTGSAYWCRMHQSASWSADLTFAQGSAGNY